jgi:hypothetical protein
MPTPRPRKLMAQKLISRFIGTSMVIEKLRDQVRLRYDHQNGRRLEFRRVVNQRHPVFAKRTDLQFSLSLERPEARASYPIGILSRSFNRFKSFTGPLPPDGPPPRSILPDYRRSDHPCSRCAHWGGAESLSHAHTPISRHRRLVRRALGALRGSLGQSSLP